MENIRGKFHEIIINSFEVMKGAESAPHPQTTETSNKAQPYKG